MSDTVHKTSRLFDYFFVLRPTLFFPVWTLVLAGHWAQTRFTGDQPFTLLPIREANLFLIFATTLFTLLMGGVFLVNQIKDVESDRLNNKLYLIANGDISVRSAVIETALIISLPIALMSFIRLDLATIMTVSFIVLGWFYSCAPLHLKNHPIGGLIANFMGGYIVFFFGWMIDGRASFEMVFRATPYALGLVAVFFFTTIPDVSGDRAAHKVTVAVRYGIGPVLRAGLITDLLAIGAAIWTRDIVIAMSTVLALPFFVFAAGRKTVVQVLQTGKFATLFLSLFICIRFPLYFLLILIVYFTSKWYYKSRFELDYPSFRT
jgi:4-hydroxybenzoate polyprenyltransferase